MKKFIQRLAEDIFKEDKRDYTDICVVFPSKRAGLFFKKELALLSGKPVWSPAVFSINEFVSELSDITLSDHLTMIFELFRIFCKHEKSESFEKFYQWGCLMLSDFNEIDRYLIEPDKLFRNLSELKDIDNQFMFDAADNEYFRRFWMSFSNTPLKDAQNQYLNIWENMGNVYREFRSELIHKGLAYEGLMYRDLCEKLNKKEVDIKWTEIIFAGFNLITPSELSIMRSLKKLTKTDFYWNADGYYFTDRSHEGGHFLRKNMHDLEINEPKWIETNLVQEEKSINITGVPLRAGQAKALAGELSTLIKNGNFDEENTVIIVPDEIVLLPLLYSLSDDIKDINVTMGYPFRSTPLYNLIELFKYIQVDCVEHKDGIINYYYKDIIHLLSHPYIKKIITVNVSDKAVNRIINRNIIYITADEVKQLVKDNNELFDFIFDCKGDALIIADKLLSILDIISDKFENDESPSYRIKGFETQYFFRLYTSLINLREVLEKYKENIEVSSFWELFLDILAEVRIPFSGEPLKGLQIMGLLEARNLDFDNVFMLSMNEGIMPGTNPRSSMIPYNLRRAFGLPVFEDDNSLNSYYFYSTFQRSKNIYLYYDAQAGEFLSGDVSRYILQIDKELSGQHDKLSVNHKTAQFKYVYPEIKDIKITKTDELLSKIKKISATQLNTYINCPFQFYMKKIAGIEESPEAEEIFSAATFGKILHAIMQSIYGNYMNIEVTEKILEDIYKNVSDESSYDELFSRALSESGDLESASRFMIGQNYLFKKVIHKLIKQLLKKDMEDAPFKIIDLECWIDSDVSIEANGNKYALKLSGIIDRIDEKDGVFRIIDYKTGKSSPQLNQKKSFNENIDLMFIEVKNKEQLQTLFYAYLYRNKIKDNNIISGIYPMRLVKDGIVFAKNTPFSNEEFEYFDKKLFEKLSSIFDKSVNYIQAEDINNCKYCSFQNFCYRN